MGNSGDTGPSDKLEETYRSQISAAIHNEAERRILENNDPIETSRLLSFSLLELFA